MARKSRKVCNKGGCFELALQGDKYCEEHKLTDEYKAKAYDKIRGNASKRGYDAIWRKARKSFLAKNPFCVRCMLTRKVTPSTVVDHIIPHKGNMKLFWGKSNWQALCKTCHDKKTVTEDGGFGKVF